MTASLETQVQALARQVDELASKDRIRECIYRVVRGVDRIDPVLLSSSFHPDAKIRWGGAETLDLKTWVDQSVAVQDKTQRVQHLVGNILIELRGDEADVESYEIARHLTSFPDGVKDLIYSARYIDKFSRREGVWKIHHRIKVMDWARIMEGSDSIWDHAGLRGARDAGDISIVEFGQEAFHRDA